MYNIGDKVREKKGKIVWTIAEFDSLISRARLECNLGHGSYGSQWVSTLNLINNWDIVAQSSSNTPDTKLFNNDWFGNWELPESDTSKEKTKKPECWHEFKKYVGLNESYEFCTKCDEKRPHNP